MVHGMYEYRDDYGHLHYLSARIGGFKDVPAAVKAIKKRGGTGYVADSHNVPLFIVRNGQIKEY